MNRKKILWGSALATGGLLLADALWLEKVYFEVKRFRIGKSDPARAVLTIVHLSDLHFKDRLVYKHRRLLRRLNRIKPDLILITGDSIDERGEASPLHDFLRQLRSAIKVLAIPGNHEHKSGTSIDELQGIYASHGGKLLLNESVVMERSGQRLAISGIDDFVEGEPQLAQALAGLPRVDQHIMLIHSPKQQEGIKRQLKEINRDRPADRKIEIDYFLAGHNHGGQVTLGNFAPKLPRKSGNYLAGWYNDEKPFLYLSRGFGTSALPVRFMAPAEIAVFYYGL